MYDDEANRVMQERILMIAQELFAALGARSVLLVVLGGDTELDGRPGNGMALVGEPDANAAMVEHAGRLPETFRRAALIPTDAEGTVQLLQVVKPQGIG